MAGTFQYANPTAISYGEGSLGVLSEVMGKSGAKRVFLVSTAPVLENPELMAVVNASLPFPPVAVAAIGGHAPVEEVQIALRKRFDADADLVISLGGGSVIDASKGVSRGKLAVAARVGAASQEGCSLEEDSSVRHIPHIAIPTTLAAAELSWRAGFSNEIGDKVGFADRAVLPAHVIYEPRLAVFTPISLWLATGIRAIDHAVEGYLSGGDHPFSDVMAVEAIFRLSGALRESSLHTRQIEPRSEAQLGAWFSYTLPLASMTGLSHQMGKQIGARHGIGHGDTSALLLPHVMRYRATLDPSRYRQLSEDLDRRFADGRSIDAAARVAELIVDLGLPQHIASFGVTAGDLGSAASEIGTAEYPAADIAKIYLEAL